ncbi:hypothetical protein DSCO28_54760 [Desulfosarcina ovata subsp. sediminis]|uniref:DSBA-like thioredoxin domain-containing protein n=2 Tax=Desulfosarcina ovata TaxID=83564 RepID=A0A5K8AHP1_9BACT|nr:hypothetical protein DSCO28_54760 [Desulfosarcina ovata subsp. sediminis]BBO91380.1 hypothetical protein DSCOOX_45600 [Desulfosarcina ovata subsp. ovata]
MHPETPAAGQALEDLFANQPVDIPAILKRLTSVARELNLPFGEQTMTYNSRLAQELGKWAEVKGCGDTFHHAMFLAYFRDGENIGSADVLIELCRGIGLDPAAAREVLSQRTFLAAVDDDWEKSRKNNIRIAPTFVMGSQRRAGYQSLETLKRLVETAGIGLRK